MALLLIGLFSLGLYMSDLPLSPQKLKLYSWHKWAGVSAFCWSCCALPGVSATGHRPCRQPCRAGRKPLQQGLHHLLYLLMIAIPLSGWLMSSAKGFQTVYFGIIPLPDLLQKNKELGELLEGAQQPQLHPCRTGRRAHRAALKHHLFDRDEVLARMLPFLARNADRPPPTPNGETHDHLSLDPCTLAVAAAGSAAAAEFNQFQAGKSSLTFVSKQMGVPIDGSFRKFAASLAFDPAKPAAATARLDLDLNSIDAGSRDANDEVVGKPWFNVKVFPTATFVSSAVRPLGGDKFELVGKLTIKGKSQDLTAPVQLFARTAATASSTAPSS
jgi:polyisoprenoid-binding protein YceI/cytochrome b561